MPGRWSRVVFMGAISVALATAGLVVGQDKPAKTKHGFKDTPMLPGGKWHVHDSDRPLPPVVTPGTCGTRDEPGKAPSDAVVLFDGKDLSAWSDDRGGTARWDVKEGAIVIRAGGGVIRTRQEFGDCQLHLEFAEPTPPRGDDQGRGNSGVLFFGRYEIQVLDNYHNPTYADGHAGAVYGQFPPLVNACREPGKWQTYDIMFTAPRFKDDGSVAARAHVTVLLNGVLVQNHTPILAPMAYRTLAQYKAHGPKGPLVLQDHGDPVRFRNIWIRELRERP